MKFLLFLLCVFCVTRRSDTRSSTYLITAPRLLRLDAVESVLVQLFGFSDDVRVHVYLKTSMAQDHVVLSQDVVTLGRQNRHQAVARVRILPGKLPQGASHVTLHVQSPAINQHVSLAISRTNGFLFVQTDKPLYTPRQSVQVRAFSLNQELQPANRSVSLTFKDPDHQTVDMIQMIDANNGILNPENPFKIPVNPKLGVWSVEAVYSGEFSTLARSDFEVKEYAVPRMNVQVAPDVHFISSRNLHNFRFTVLARYLNGVPVSDGEVLLRYGYISGQDPVIVPTSFTNKRLTSSGNLILSINVEDLLLMNLEELLGKHLYVSVMVQEKKGGLSQEAELTSVKFVRTPFRLSLVSTSSFFKPGLSYNIQVLVKDHRDRPMSQVPVRMLKRQMFRASGASEEMPCGSESVSQSDGVAVFTCHTVTDSVRVALEFQTDNLPPTSQARLSVEAAAYHSPNRRYLLVDPPVPAILLVGQQAYISVFWNMPDPVPARRLSYQVLSRGTVVHFGALDFVSNSARKLTVGFRVTAAMVPSVRLLVYIVTDTGETPELVSDSVRLDVQHKCVNALQTIVSLQPTTYKPKAGLQLDISTSHEGLVALSAVDSGLLSLRPNYRDPVSMVLRHVQQSDLGCGGGGGRDAADVLQMTGLTFITNTQTRPATSDGGCQAVIRRRRSPTPEEIKAKVETYPENYQPCCERGMEKVPKSMNCIMLAEIKLKTPPFCRVAFIQCCRFYKGNIDKHLQRLDEPDLDWALASTLVRSYFPESWLWEVQPVRSGKQSFMRTLPDSLTTWEIRAVGMFSTGMCVADPVHVRTQLPLSLDVPLPYQVVRGEQLELHGSVYNQQGESVRYQVKLLVGAAICLHGSQPAQDHAGFRTSASDWRLLRSGYTGKISFTLLGLKVGEHTLTFTLGTRLGLTDILVKKLHVVPEGVRQEVFTGGRLDPTGVFGSEKMRVLLKNERPTNMIPDSDVQRLLTINGQILGDIESVLLDQEGLQQLVNLPRGSAEAELAHLQTLVQLYRHLEDTRSWSILGGDTMKKAADVRRRIREGLVSISSFRREDSSYSMWRRREGSTWLTASVIRVMAAADPVVSVDRQALSDSLAWLIRARQQADGSFAERSTFRPNRVMAGGAEPTERSVYLTAFVLTALIPSTRIRDPILQLQFHDNSIKAAASYVSQHARAVKTVYVQAVAAYALTLHDPDSVTSNQLITGLEKLARQKGNPAELRYWQESSAATADGIRPDESSGLTVETTAYVLMTVLLKGSLMYANPILTWLTQDNRGHTSYSAQDLAVTLEGISQYRRLAPRVVLQQDINIRYSRKGSLGRVQLTESRPVATPIQVKQDDDIEVMTGYGSGVSNVKMKTVFYQMTPTTHNCHFDLTTDIKDAPGFGSYLEACVRYKPPINEVVKDSGLTVMKIQLPTGVDPFLEDLVEYRDFPLMGRATPLISHLELEGNTLTIQMESVQSANSSCLAFRFRTSFKVQGARQPLISVFEPQDKGSICSSHFSLEQNKLQRYCVDADCQCMTVTCATFRGNNDSQVSLEERRKQTCHPAVKYVYRVKVNSKKEEGDFETFTASVVEVLRSLGDFEEVRRDTEVDLIKKITCSLVDIQNQQQYLIIGSNGLKLNHQTGYRLVLDSEAVVEVWPEAKVSVLDDLALDLQLQSCS